VSGTATGLSSAGWLGEHPATIPIEINNMAEYLNRNISISFW
jgi:hypothetical protein